MAYQQAVAAGLYWADLHDENGHLARPHVHVPHVHVPHVHAPEALQVIIRNRHKDKVTCSTVTRPSSASASSPPLNMSPIKSSSKATSQSDTNTRPSLKSSIRHTTPSGRARLRQRMGDESSSSLGTSRTATTTATSTSTSTTTSSSVLSSLVQAASVTCQQSVRKRVHKVTHQKWMRPIWKNLLLAKRIAAFTPAQMRQFVMGVTLTLHLFTNYNKRGGQVHAQLRSVFMVVVVPFMIPPVLVLGIPLLLFFGPFLLLAIAITTLNRKRDEQCLQEWQRIHGASRSSSSSSTTTRAWEKQQQQEQSSSSSLLKSLSRKSSSFFGGGSSKSLGSSSRRSHDHNRRRNSLSSSSKSRRGSFSSSFRRRSSKADDYSRREDPSDSTPPETTMSDVSLTSSFDLMERSEQSSPSPASPSSHRPRLVSPSTSKKTLHTTHPHQHPHQDRIAMAMERAAKVEGTASSSLPAFPSHKTDLRSSLKRRGSLLLVQSRASRMSTRQLNTVSFDDDDPSTSSSSR